METMLLYFALPYKFIAQACGIAAGMAVNFVMLKTVVFKGGK
jgi:putative flippase GtrA